MIIAFPLSNMYSLSVVKFICDQAEKKINQKMKFTQRSAISYDIDLQQDLMSLHIPYLHVFLW